MIHKIDKLRITYGVTQRAMAKAADITPEYYSKVIAGKADVSLRVLERLAKVVGCKIMLVFEAD